MAQQPGSPGLFITDLGIVYRFLFPLEKQTSSNSPDTMVNAWIYHGLTITSFSSSQVIPASWHSLLKLQLSSFLPSSHTTHIAFLVSFKVMVGGGEIEPEVPVCLRVTFPVTHVQSHVKRQQLVPTDCLVEGDRPIILIPMRIGAA